MAHVDGHQNGGGQIAIAIQERAVSENPDAGPDGAGFRDDGAAYTMEARTVPQAVAHGVGHNSEPGMAWRVRRLTPTECERLQGVPDGFTLVPYGRRLMADGPRYKMLGNSMAVNVMRWLGQRILLVDKL
jgi:DNA (cytosine-5)-methyltransferase 1